jgi:hypothetical protein
MKRKKVNQVVTGVLSTSILMSSCTQYSLTDPEFIYKNLITNDSDLGATAIPISLRLKPEDMQYIMALQKMSVDILDSPQKAKDFGSDPASFLKQYGYDGEVNIDDSLWKITMALADEDINNAIRGRDFTTFIKLCVEKGYISSSEGIFADDFYKTQLDELYRQGYFEKFKKGQLDNGLRSDTIVADDPFFVAAVLVLAAVAIAVAAIWAIAVWQEAVKVSTAGLGSSGANDFSADLNMIDIYALKAGMEDTYIAVDEYTEDIVDKSILILKDIQPDLFETAPEIEVRNLIKINVVNNLGKISYE